MADKDIMVEEKVLLKEIGSRLTEARVQELARSWRTYYV